MLKTVSDIPILSIRGGLFVSNKRTGHNTIINQIIITIPTITVIIHPNDYHHHRGYHHHYRHILRAGMRAQGWVQPKAVPQDVIIVVASPLFFIIITIIAIIIVFIY